MRKAIDNNQCADKLILETILQDKFFYFKAEEGGVAVATATDDNAANEKSGKSRVSYLFIRCTGIWLYQKKAFR